MRPNKDCRFCLYIDESGDCLSHKDCFDNYESFKPKYEVYYVTPEDKSYKHTEHICLSCKQSRDNCPPYSADFASVYACVNFEAGIKNKEKYPHVIRKLIRT